jgi:hypothetical protein
MSNAYKQEYYDFLQQQTDQEDELVQRERESEREKWRTLNQGLQRSHDFLRLAKEHGINIANSRQVILPVLKQYIPEVWSVAGAEPLINLLFQNSK